MLAYSKKLIRIIEAWNGEIPESSGFDLVRLYQQPSPIVDMLCREFPTILLDLREEPETLLSKMKKDMRYEINRASAKDNLIYEYFDSGHPEVLNEFFNYYDAFALQKGQRVINRQWLSLMSETKNLTISRVREVTGETLVWHTYHRNGGGRATLLNSASLFRNNISSAYRSKVGRANRFHHWQDILKFKSAGDSIYDFGGWYRGGEDSQRLGINKFKEEFGGEIVVNYICERGVTVKGKLFLLLRQSLLGNAI